VKTPLTPHVATLILARACGRDFSYMPSGLYNPDIDVVIVSRDRILGHTWAFGERQKKFREGLRELFRVVLCSVGMKRPVDHKSGNKKDIIKWSTHQCHVTSPLRLQVRILGAARILLWKGAYSWRQNFVASSTPGDWKDLKGMTWKGWLALA